MPYLSVPGHSGDLRPDDSPIPAGEAASLATPEARLDGTAEELAALLAAALRRFDGLTKRDASKQDDVGRVDARVDEAREGAAAGLLRAIEAAGR